ncbi:LytR family transcriptional regulator [Romboutsia ilealis]|uniref:LCP family protein n=1 Tax=Romboutsia faecis TaxID=2764597 RepID=A0ABR7JLM6_9FIRM|nr:LCP family protein [Romboutsia faecis]MBC5995821.1 LCP family protein [Romboutsia faecis]MRN23020.1 LytR family transcriptional regulator [Romboutsia ilealis]
MKNAKKILIVAFSIIFIIVLSGFGFIYSNLSKMYVKDEKVNTEEKEDQVQGTEVEGIVNILLVGTDGENVERSNRSDSVMLVTIDNKNKDIKISSIARDTYVDIPGHSTEKLTHAYAYGGIDLLKQVLDVNFDIKVDKYIAVNFVSFMDIIDEIGGVEVTVEEKDVDEVNKYIDACYDYYYNRKDKVEKVYIKKPGLQRLNGYQALAFSRIRYTDSAYARDNRHREVAESVYKEFLHSEVKEYQKAAEIIIENTKTNISPMEMINLGFTALNIKDKEIDQFQFPLEEYRNGHIINNKKGWVIEWDKEPNLSAWHSFIYGEN